MHGEIDGEESEGHSAMDAGRAFALIVVQISLVDLVFSIDSIVTAIGMAQDIEVMIAAVLIAMVVMYVASGSVAGFIARHPTTKMLALAFLILIGVALVADGFEVHIPRGYVYFAMAFAAMVESINILAHRRRSGRDKG
jgi:predicted tellurium resistance membrane protein TerC